MKMIYSGGDAHGRTGRTGDKHTHREERKEKKGGKARMASAKKLMIMIWGDTWIFSTSVSHIRTGCGW